MFRAIHDGKPDQGLLAYQYLQTLPKIAQGEANKMWIVPSEFSKALEGLSRLGGGDGESRSWLDVEPSTNGAARDGNAAADGIDTSGWFESQLPRAADQPEAKIELSSIQPGLPTVPPPSQVARDVAGRADEQPPRA